MRRFLWGLAFLLAALVPQYANAQSNVGLWCGTAGQPLGWQVCTGQPFHLIAAGSNNSTLVAAGAHLILGAQLSGVGSAPAYLKFYDKATAPTCGTDTPIKVLMIPAASTAANGADSNVTIALGTVVVNGLGFCVVAGIADSDNTSVSGATFVINFDWK